MRWPCTWHERREGMWARVVEIMLACWLAISPFVFRHDPDARGLWWNDLVCGFVILLCALLAYRAALGKIHLINGGIGLWLVGSAFLTGITPPSPAIQNHVVVGLLLMMLAIIPSRAAMPPRSWRQFYEDQRGTEID